VRLGVIVGDPAAGVDGFKSTADFFNDGELILDVLDGALFGELLDPLSDLFFDHPVEPPF
jgi:hypothetical protein